MQHYDISYNLHLGGRQKVVRQNGENWDVTCVDTGLNTMTGGRLLKVKDLLVHDAVNPDIDAYHKTPYVDVQDNDFFLTYGDGVGNIDILDVLTLHNESLNIVTTTAYKSLARFGVLDIKDDKVLSFKEKPEDQQPWINAGFMVCSTQIFDYLEDDTTVLEHAPLQRLAEEGKMGAYKHFGFWKAMDTLRDKMELEDLYKEKGHIYG
jgi:glucose-1-phosphate cytidylyltransferase